MKQNFDFILAEPEFLIFFGFSSNRHSRFCALEDTDLFRVPALALQYDFSPLPLLHSWIFLCAGELVFMRENSGVTDDISVRRARMACPARLDI